MAKWGQFYLTEYGVDLRQRAIAEGKNIVFPFGRMGKGVPASPDDIWGMTDLIDPVHEIAVKKSYAEHANHRFIFAIDNKDYQAEVLMREMGVYALLEDEPETQPLLYGYAYAVSGYETVPAGADFNRVWQITADTRLSRTEQISIVYDGSATYITPDDLDAHDTNNTSHPAILQALMDRYTKEEMAVLWRRRKTNRTHYRICSERRRNFA